MGRKEDAIRKITMVWTKQLYSKQIDSKRPCLTDSCEFFLSNDILHLEADFV